VSIPRAWPGLLAWHLSGREAGPPGAPAPVLRDGATRRDGPPPGGERVAREVHPGVLRWPLMRSGAAAGRAAGIGPRNQMWAGAGVLPVFCRCSAWPGACSGGSFRSGAAGGPAQAAWRRRAPPPTPSSWRA